MKISKIQPTEPLKPYVNAILIIESETEVINRLLPGTAPVMAFQFKGKVYINDSTIPRFGLTGISRMARSAHYTPGSGVLLVLFKEGMAPAFLDTPLSEFAGFTTGLEHIFPADDLHLLEDQLYLEKPLSGKVSVIERFLLSHLKRDIKDQAISKAIEMIKQQKGNIRIRDLVSLLNTNIDSFEKKFRARVGISPKNFSSIIRMQSIIADYKADQNLTVLSLDKGFFDQSHFIRDFKTFTGQNPTAFFKTRPAQW